MPCTARGLSPAPRGHRVAKRRQRSRARRLRLVLGRGQLNNSRELACRQRSQEHNLSARQLERIVMHRSAPLIHLAEAGYLGSSFLRALPETRRDFDLALERKLRSRFETNGGVRLADGAEPARERMLKSRCDELVADKSWARSQMF
jgi:hypothetical protein